MQWGSALQNVYKLICDTFLRKKTVYLDEKLLKVSVSYCSALVNSFILPSAHMRSEGYGS